MTQTLVVNVTIDPAANRKPDRADHIHTVVRGTTASSDMTVSLDPTAIKTITRLRACFDFTIDALSEGTELMP